MGIRLTETNHQIHEKIITELFTRFIVAFRKLETILPKKIRPLLRTKFEESLTWQSLKGGELMGHFGLPKTQVNTRLEKILTTWLNSLRVRNTLTINFTGGLKMEAIDSSFQDVFSLPASVVITAKGEHLPWLEWLLTRGDETVIENYHVMFGDYNRQRRSRSGLAIMVPKGSWGVPKEFASRGEFNFVTDIIKNVLEGAEFENLIAQEVRRAV